LPGSRLAAAIGHAAVTAALLAPLCAFAAPTRDTEAQHLLDRLAFGPRPGDVQQVEAMGADAYIAQQLDPDSIPLPADLQQQLGALDTLNLSPTAVFEKYGPAPHSRGEKPSKDEKKAERQRAREVAEQAMDARLLRDIESPRQLQEVMVNFWFDHFNVYAGKGLDALWLGAYERDAIRPYALGRFHDLLFATAKSPAMLFYLDNWLNSAPGSDRGGKRFAGINENYARELMELHTLGVDGGYTQADVTTLAHILTGWGLCPRQGRRADPGGFCFDPRRHDDGEQVFLGQKLHGGEDEVRQAITLLADSPATAKHVTYQLAQYFVSDTPPQSLLNELMLRWNDTDGDISAVLQTLFQSPEFRSAQYTGNKFKTPYEFVVSAVRAEGTPVDNLRPLLGELRTLGMPLYGCLTPDGYKNTQAAWLNPDALMLRLSFAMALGHGDVRLEPDAPPGQTPEQETTALYATLSGLFTPQQIAVIDGKPQGLQPGLILGSPQFMYR
jgi:uncharacterized protein (DUF1800 family)